MRAAREIFADRQLLAALAERQQLHKNLQTDHSLTVRLLNLDDAGNPIEEIIEVLNG